jgi:hypothetical protein
MFGFVLFTHVYLHDVPYNDFYILISNTHLHAYTPYFLPAVFFWDFLHTLGPCPADML